MTGLGYLEAEEPIHGWTIKKALLSVAGIAALTATLILGIPIGLFLAGGYAGLWLRRKVISVFRWPSRVGVGR